MTALQPSYLQRPIHRNIEVMLYLECAMLDTNWILALGLLLAFGTLGVAIVSGIRQMAEQEARKRLIPIRIRASDYSSRQR
jgi:hypothetical protein